MKYILLFVFLSSCYISKYDYGEKYYLTERYFEHENFFWKDSIYPAEWDRFGYYIWLPTDDGKYYRKVYCNDLVYMKIYFR